MIEDASDALEIKEYEDIIDALQSYKCLNIDLTGET